MKKVCKKILAVFMALMMVIPSLTVLESIDISQSITAQAATKKTSSEKVSKEKTSTKKTSTKKTTVSTPKNLKITAMASDSLDVSFSKVNKANGYVIYYSTSKKFTKKTTNKLTVKVTKKHVKKKIVTKRISKLKNNKKYYIKVRAYRVVDKKKVYSKYTSVKSAKAKKIVKEEVTTTVATTPTVTQPTTTLPVTPTVPSTDCKVSFDTDGGTVIESQTIQKGTTAQTPNIPSKEGFAFVGWYANKEYTKEFDFSQPINSSCTVYARWINLTDKTDSDGDGLTDAFEEYYRTNPLMADTDGDGLSDYLEIAVLNYNALAIDTDNNGVSDADEDYDNDGINNKVEVDLGTDPSLSDTDGDGLSDKSEIDTYKTDPLAVDTDLDGVSDGKEIELGTDPLVAQTNFTVDFTVKNNNDSVKPSVEIDLKGEQVETLSIEPVNDDNLFPETMPGYMGKAYNFSVDGKFSSANISFEFDSSTLDEDADPVICYYNEETQELEELDTTVANGVATATVTHFSKYILVDRTVYNKSFQWTDVWDSNENYTNAEIVLVIDDSGSLGGDYGYNPSKGVFTGGKDPEHKRLEVAKNFIDNANSNSKIGIVKFDGVIDNITGDLIECNGEGKEKLKSYLQLTYVNDGDYNIHNIFDSRGATYMYAGVEEAINELLDAPEHTMKVAIVFTDGDAHDSGKHSSVISKAINNNIKIYTVGLGTSSSYFENYLKPLASQTGGAFYNASDAEQLADIYENISQKIDIETDSDSDGIPDYYEDNMIFFNGVKIELDKYNPDTDGDGIKDGEEIVLKYKYNADKTKVMVTGKMVKGDPSKKDTDGDGYIDSKDSNPLKWDITDRDLAMCSSMSYSFIPVTKTLDSLSSSLNKEIEKRFDNVASLKELGRWSVIDTWYADGGLQALAFMVDSNIVIAYRGSDEGIDWFNNATTYVLGISTHTAGAKKFIKNVMSCHSGYNIYVTGHSLGGHLAYNAAAEGIDYNKSAIKGIVTFNGLGLTLGLTLVGDLWDEQQLLKKQEVIRNYSVEGDPVSKGFLGFTTFHYGTTCLYAQSANAPDAHSLYTFLEQLDPVSRYQNIK